MINLKRQATIISIIILGLGLRLISLNQSLWIDEATSALTTKMTLADFFGKFMVGDFHPPLYYLTLRVWSMLFGTSEVALRSLSVLFGIGVVYLVYLLGKNLINKETGIVAALMAATSGLLIYYSQEARMYSMSAFLVTLAVYIFTKILHKGRAGDWVAFSLILGLIGLTDYLPLLILPVFLIIGILRKENYQWFKRYVMSHIIVAVFALLWLPVFLKQLTSGLNVTNNSPAWVSVLGTFSIKDVLLIPVKFVIGRVSFDNHFLYAFVVGLSFLVVGFLIYRSKKYLKELRIIYIWLFVPLFLALIISLKLPVLNYFRFLFVVPALYVTIAAGVVGLAKKWQAVFVIVLLFINLVTSFMYLTNQKFQREDWRSAAGFIEGKRSVDSLIIFPRDSQMEAYRYYSPNALIYGPEAVKKGYLTIWLMRYAQPISDPSDSTRKKIEGIGYTKTEEFDFNGVGVWKYTY